MTSITVLIGGLGLFLLGMSMMTDGLKLAAGDALRTMLDSWTKNRIRALLAGIFITALVQSSSAVTVATIGFVNAGLLTLNQAVWVVFGTTIGTTMIGWLVAFVGIKVNVVVLALPILGVGAFAQLALRRHVRLAATGQALAGFGLFFLGVSVLQEGFTGLGSALTDLGALGAGWQATLVFTALGFLMTLLTQSSSAAVALILTASSQVDITLSLTAAAVIGTNIATTSTVLIATIGATPAAKRVDLSHAIFNIATAAVALAALAALLTASGYLLNSAAPVPSRLAIFHTTFNGLGVLLMWPTTAYLVRWLATLFRTDEEISGQPRHLDDARLQIPTLAIRGLVLELLRIRDIAFGMIRLKIESPAIDQMSLREGRHEVESLGRAVRGFVEKLS